MSSVPGLPWDGQAACLVVGLVVVGTVGGLVVGIVVVGIVGVVLGDFSRLG